MTAGSSSTAFGYGSSNFTYVYGGVIGNIMGGDNIIDNVSDDITPKTHLAIKRNKDIVFVPFGPGRGFQDRNMGDNHLFRDQGRDKVL